MKKYLVLFLLGWILYPISGEAQTSYLRTDGRASNSPFASDVENGDPTLILIPHPGRVNLLYCKFDNFRTDGTATFTVRKNRRDTILTCSTDSQSAECRATGTVSVAAGDLISVKQVDTAESTAPTVRCSVSYEKQ